MSILVDVPEMQRQLVSAHGMLAILEVLEGKSSSRDIIIKLLRIVNLVSFLVAEAAVQISQPNALKLVTTDAGFLESFCLIG